MSVRSRNTCLRSVLAPSALVVLATVTLSVSAQAADLPQALINECNSEITISQVPQTGPDIEVGETVNVTLTLTSTDAQDGVGTQIPQAFDKATYTGDCMVPPGLPCTAKVPADFMYLGNVGGSCTGVTPNPIGNSVVEFNLAPLVLGPPSPDSCTITFDVQYTAAGTAAAQANLSGSCQAGAFSSDTTVTTVITVLPVVPTLGQFGLAILALVLMVGSWMILRRKKRAFAD